MHFSSLIHKMSMLTLVISCLTMSNLPWFMDLTFQVPMQYCSLLHWTLLSIPDIVTTECHFHFGPGTSFFLELLLYHNCPLPFPSSKLDIFWPGRVHLPVSYLFTFSYCSWSSHSKNTGVICHLLPQQTIFCQNSSLWPIHLGWSYMAWVTAFLSYASPFGTTRLWSMKGQEGKLVVIEALTNSWGKTRHERQGRRGKINTTECRVSENSKEK